MEKGLVGNTYIEDALQFGGEKDTVEFFDEQESLAEF
jgi:hypothetical protein